MKLHLSPLIRKAIAFPEIPQEDFYFLDLIGRNLVTSPVSQPRQQKTQGLGVPLMLRPVISFSGTEHIVTTKKRGGEFHYEREGGNRLWVGQLEIPLSPPNHFNWIHSLLLNFILYFFSIFLHLSSLPSTSPWKTNFQTFLLTFYLPPRIK